jgi:hypothetical protein
MSIPSNRGGAAHGHLAIIITFQKYDVMLAPGTQWEDPVNPGITPDILGDNNTQFQTNNNNRAFAANIVEWNTYLSTSRALKTQLAHRRHRSYLH